MRTKRVTFYTNLPRGWHTWPSTQGFPYASVTPLEHTTKGDLQVAFSVDLPENPMEVTEVPDGTVDSVKEAQP